MKRCLSLLPIYCFLVSHALTQPSLEAGIRIYGQGEKLLNQTEDLTGWSDKRVPILRNAREQFESALDQFTISNENAARYWEIKSKVMIGITSDELNEAPRAVAVLQEALELSEHMKRNELSATISEKLAHAYERLDDRSTALRWAEQAILRWRRIDPTPFRRRGLMFALRLLGHLREADGDGDRALQIYSEAIQIAIELKDESTQSNLSSTQSKLVHWLDETDDGQKQSAILQVETGPTGLVDQLAWSPTGEYILAKDDLSSACLWSRAAKQQILCFPSAGDIKAIAFSPTRPTFFTLNLVGELRLWSLPRARPVSRIGLHMEEITCAVFMPDGNLVATGNSTGVVKIWDPTFRNVKRRFVGHTMAVTAVAVSSDGRYVASGSADGSVRLWDLVDERQSRQLETNPEPSSSDSEIRQLRFLPNGDPGLLVLREKNSGLWDIGKGSEKGTKAFDLPDGTVDAAFSPVGSQLIWIANGALYRLRLAGGLKTPEVISQDSVESFALSSNDEIAVGLSDAFEIRSLDSGNLLASLTRKSANIHETEVSASGRYLAIGNEGNSGSALEIVRVWDLSRGKEIDAYAQTSRILSIAFSNREDLLAVGTKDKNARIWDIKSGINLETYPHEQGVKMLAFSPNDAILLTLTDKPLDKSVHVWDRTRKSKRFVLDHKSAVRSASFSSDGSLVLTLSGLKYDGKYTRMLTATVWDLRSGKQVHVINDVTAASFPPIGRMLLSSNGNNTSVWDTNTWSVIGSLVPPKDDEAVVDLAFSHSGSRVLTLHKANAYLWDIDSYKLLHVYPGGWFDALHASFALDDNHILIAGGRTKFVETESGNQICSVDYSILDGDQIKSMRDQRLIFVDVYDTTHFLNYLTCTEPLRLGLFEDGSWVAIDSKGRFDANDVRSLTAAHWLFGDNPLLPLSLDVFMRDYYYPRLVQLSRENKAADPAYSELFTSYKHRTMAVSKPTSVGQPYNALRQNDIRSPIMDDASSLSDKGQDSMISLASLNRTQPMISVIGVRPDIGSGNTVSVKVRIVNGRSRVQKGIDGKYLNSGAYDLRLFRDGQLVGQWPKTSAGATGRSNISSPAVDRQAWRKVHKLTLKNNEYVHSFSHIQLPLREGVGSVQFTAYAFNSDRVKSLISAALQYSVPTARAPFSRRAYLITMGVNANESHWNLDFAVASAEAAARMLHTKLAEVYEIVECPLYSTLRSDSPQVLLKAATRDNLKTILDLLAGRQVSNIRRLAVAPCGSLHAARPDDAVVLFISSHGYADPEGTFYAVPYDTGALYITESDLSRCGNFPRKGTVGCEKSSTFLAHAISSQDLAEWWTGVDAGEMVMILDSCHSAAIPGRTFRAAPLGDPGFGQLSYDKGMRILSATQSDKTARVTLLQELPHSLLIEALLEAGKVRPKDNIAEWLHLAQRQLPIVTRNLYPELNDDEIQLPEIFDFAPHKAPSH